MRFTDRPRLHPGNIEVIDDAVADMLRRKTPAQRLAMAFDSHRTARLLLEGGLRMQHPEWNADQVKREIARRILHGSS